LIYHEAFEAGDKHKDILRDDRFIASNFSSRKSRTDNFPAMLTMGGICAGTEDIFNLALLTAEVIKIAFLDGLIKPVNCVKVCQA
jgi:hypothetical protein